MTRSHRPARDEDHRPARDEDHRPARETQEYAKRVFGDSTTPQHSLPTPRQFLTL